MRTRSGKLNQSTSALPAPTTPTSSSRLPPELIAHIQRLAEDDCAGLAERKEVRATMELVCKDWYRAAEHLAHVVLEGVADVARLSRELRSSKLRELLGAKTKTVSVNVSGFAQMADVNKLSALLRWVTAVEHLFVEGEFRACGLANRDENILRQLVKALSEVGPVRHLEFGQATSEAYWVQR
jgi:hypothetical protein